jgi:hypothetical protein
MGTVVLDEAPIDRSRLISRCGFREIDDPARHKGARSLMRTTTERPVRSFVTRTSCRRAGSCEPL